MRPSDQIPAAAAEQRSRRGGRGAVTVGATLVLVALLSGAFLLSGSGAARGPRRVVAGTPPGLALSQAAPVRPPHLGRRLAALEARGNARIRRLARLGLPIYCAGHRGHALAFTFDDGPGPYTHLALRKLREAHQRATFFVVGKSMNSWPGYLPQELRVAAVGDHTYTHPDLAELPRSHVDPGLG